ncbi:MAG: sensor histidine kinase, partial [Rhodospirillales bacterium]|nr:sensor histidine kinase [Rhodospirillales bacterium]
MADEPGKSSFFNSLSARLLVLAIGFVMLAEFLIYAPSVARYRKDYLEERVAEAHLATLALEALAEKRVGPELRGKLLSYARAHTIVLRLPESSVFALGQEKPPLVEATFDLRVPGFFGWISQALDALMRGGNRVLRIIGPSPNDPSVLVEVTIDEAPMLEEMFSFSRRIMGLSIVISVITASLLFVCLQWLMVGPMGRITESMTSFRADPERENPVPLDLDREDEIGRAGRELSAMQNDLRQALKQKERLAALGSAMAKINHDLRNSLATAVLVADRLSTSQDPDVKRYAPRLYAAIDRAVQLCAETLNFVSDAKPPLNKSRFGLARLADEVGAGISADEMGLDAI